MSTSHGHGYDRRRSSTKSTSTSKSSKSSKSNTSSSPQQHYITLPEDPGLSFIFIVNELAVNEEPTSGMPPQDVEGRWVPPLYARGFYRQTPGRVYRWNNGHVTRLDEYQWHHLHINADGDHEAANGIVAGPNRMPLTRYRTATVFYANPFMKFRTTHGDASARDLYTNGDVWHHLRFHHIGPYNNISYVDHAGTEDYVAGRSNTCPWHKQLIPQAYECQDDDTDIFPSGGLAGLLPILIALVAFSCGADELNGVLTRDRAWRNRNWVRHDRRTGRREKRGMVVTVYLDPENPDGSTPDSLENFENADGDNGRPIFRPGV